MFALACSRLLIVNLLESQVGLYNGGNMGLLKIVFEEHLSMYGKLDRRQVERLLVLSARCNESICRAYHWPKILFLIQGFSGRTPLTSLARTVTSGLEEVWDSIEKPEELQDRRLQDYFTFDFEFLPDFLKDSEQYNSQVNLLRKRFVEKQSSDYLLKNADPNSISADGLELRISKSCHLLTLNYNF